MRQGTTTPLGLDPWAGLSGTPQTPPSADDWQERLKRFQEMGLPEDSWMIRNANIGLGLAEDREAMRSELRDRVGRSLGFKGQDATAIQAAGSTAAKSGSLLSSL